MGKEEDFAAACARAQLTGLIAIKTDSEEAQDRAFRHLLAAAAELGFEVDDETDTLMVKCEHCGLCYAPETRAGSHDDACPQCSERGLLVDVERLSDSHTWVQRAKKLEVC